MNYGYINIKENEHNEFVVEIKLVDGTLWLTQHEIADLFNVHVGTVGNNLRAIFKSGLLREEDVTRKHSFVYNGHQRETTLYNLEVLIFVGYRIASFEAQAFREWAMKSFQARVQSRKSNEPKVWAVYLNAQKMPIVSILN